MDGRQALRSVGNDADGGEEVNKSHLAGGKDGSARHAELMMTCHALEATAGRNVIGLSAPAARAHGLAVGLRPTHMTEGAIGVVFAALVDVAEIEGARRGGEKEVLGHLSSPAMPMHRI